jgi:hypothetical protein
VVIDHIETVKSSGYVDALAHTVRLYAHANVFWPDGSAQGGEEEQVVVWLGISELETCISAWRVERRAEALYTTAIVQIVLEGLMSRTPSKHSHSSD